MFGQRTFFQYNELQKPVDRKYYLDTGFLSPSATGEDYNQWTNPTNAYSSNNSYATEVDVNQKQDYYNFTFNIPAGATIDGIEVVLEAKTQDTFWSPKISVALSYNGGTNYTSEKQTSTLTTSDANYTLGGSTDTWGRTWDDTEFSDTNFRAYVEYNASIGGDTTSLDHIQIKVYYTGGTTTSTSITSTSSSTTPSSSTSTSTTSTSSSTSTTSTTTSTSTTSTSTSTTSSTS